MELATLAMLLAAGVLGGAVNAVAGGGTFFTFPAMMWAGLDPLSANASNAVAIFPGHAAAVPAYRAELRAAGRALLPRCAIALLGGGLGAGLLLWAGQAVFAALVPWLLLAATLIFAAGPILRDRLERARLSSPAVSAGVEFLFAVYGGYFGAGLGILLMAVLTIVGVRDVQMANAQKNLLATLVTAVSVSAFVLAGVVAWPQTLAVLAGALAGGYWGARLARRLPARALRATVLLVGGALSVFYFTR